MMADCSKLLVQHTKMNVLQNGNCKYHGSCWICTGERDDDAVDRQSAAGAQLRLRGQLQQSEPGEERARQSNLYDAHHTHHHDAVDDPAVNLPAGACQRSVLTPLQH